MSISCASVLPKIQANYAGAADALMLDSDGFVSETNATNVFMVKGDRLVTPTADYCLPGTVQHVPLVSFRLASAGKGSLTEVTGPKW